MNSLRHIKGYQASVLPKKDIKHTSLSSVFSMQYQANFSVTTYYKIPGVFCSIKFSLIYAYSQVVHLYIQKYSLPNACRKTSHHSVIVTKLLEPAIYWYNHTGYTKRKAAEIFSLLLLQEALFCFIIRSPVPFVLPRVYHTAPVLLLSQ